MDISKRLIKTNFCCAFILSLYFYLQTYDGFLQMASFVLAIPVVKIIMTRMCIPIQFEDGYRFPVKELIASFIKFGYGLWIVLLIEFIRRIFYVGVYNGILSMFLMLLWLLGFVFSNSIGICHTNLKKYKSGTFPFEIIQWIKIIIAILMGSKWVLNVAF
jgi:hypothetical protein